MIKEIMLDATSLDMFEERFCRDFKKYEIVDKFDKDLNELEFLNKNNSSLVFSYYIKDMSEIKYQLIIVIEEERVLYLIMNEENIVCDEFVIDEVEVFQYM